MKELRQRADRLLNPAPNPRPLKGEVRDVAIQNAQQVSKELSEAILKRNNARRLTLGGLAANSINSLFSPLTVAGSLGAGELGSQVITKQPLSGPELVAALVLPLACLTGGLVIGTAKEALDWRREARNVKKTSAELRDLEWQLGVKSELMKRYDDMLLATGATWVRYTAIGVGVLGSILGSLTGGTAGFFAGGVGAIPGAILGGAAGFVGGSTAIHILERFGHYAVGHQLANEARRIRAGYKTQEKNRKK